MSTITNNYSRTSQSYACLIPCSMFTIKVFVCGCLVTCTCTCVYFYVYVFCCLNIFVYYYLSVLCVYVLVRVYLISLASSCLSSCRLLLLENPLFLYHFVCRCIDNLQKHVEFYVPHSIVSMKSTKIHPENS